ncbi:MAG: hypothetical protein FJX67_02170 [Alphaproteobacteria bacterium]|nr:hypothetical protein [Alphaproteobacteria bacterium]
MRSVTKALGAMIAVLALMLIAAPAEAGDFRGGFSLHFGDGYHLPPPYYHRHYHRPPPRHYHSPRTYGCHPVERVTRDWYGRRVAVAATQCYDAWGRPYIVAGSERPIGYW